MITRRWRSSPRSVLMQITVASVHGHKPLIGWTSEVEVAWEQLKKRHRLRERTQLCKVASQDDFDAPTRKAEINSSLQKSATATDVGRVMLKFRELEAAEVEAKKEDVYSPKYVPKKFAKDSAEYGRPKPGSLTEKRAIKASKHIAREMLQVCEVIEEYGRRSKDGRIKISFGDLFNVYQFISDKLVGILLRARKHGMVAFEGEMLFQRRDDDVPITLLLSHEEIQYAVAAASTE